jgi:hypothetical protein
LDWVLVVGKIGEVDSQLGKAFVKLVAAPSHQQSEASNDYLDPVAPVFVV